MLIQPRRASSPSLHLNTVPDSGVLTSILSKTSSTLRKEPSRPSRSWDLEGQPASLPRSFHCTCFFFSEPLQGFQPRTKARGRDDRQTSSWTEGAPVWG